MKKVIALLLTVSVILSAKDYRKNTTTISVMNTLVKEYDFERAYLEKLFSNVKVQKSALHAFIPAKKRPKRKETRSKEQIAKAKKIYAKYGPWERYSRHKLSSSRVDKGVAFLKKYQTTFEKVEVDYGVPKEYIAAIIGIESAYGKNVGKYPVFDTLSTLSFEKNRRNKFFKRELIKFIHLSQTQKFNPKNVYGSYAGAIGLGQFMPSNYEAYGVDFNGDGKITLQKQQDAIASIANYFKKNGWRKGEPVATRVRYEGTRFKQYKTGYKKTYNRKDLKGIAPQYGWEYKDKVRLIKLNKKKYDELWYGAKNFFVITRYNHSAYYAMSVHQLALLIADKMRDK
ncbi:MAG: lytic murein transglycosylase B [Epsilonproteobacteria bacterium]|nr:MAG: lytic murein transglycosylase B [Campylobacterota bacterium]